MIACFAAVGVVVSHLLLERVQSANLLRTDWIGAQCGRLSIVFRVSRALLSYLAIVLYLLELKCM
jgi:hypothetical protein